MSTIVAGDVLPQFTTNSEIQLALLLLLLFLLPIFLFFLSWRACLLPELFYARY